MLNQVNGTASEVYIQRRGPWWGVLMSHVDSKKWQYCMFLSLIFPYVPSRFQEIAMYHVPIFQANVVVTKVYVALSNFEKMPSPYQF